MFCRMTKTQRDALLAVINATVQADNPSATCVEYEKAEDAEEAFHAAFKNECNMDD